ncbi:MAG: MBL fold metallo-hydrolase [Candidatus Doudnabacteria bacterium]|nr:MBL fold metallo-hydrolase [Candidatus Doudnabacteria bacterium]
MTITKYLHSCVVLEEGGKRLVFDPGAFVFIEGKCKPEGIGPVDVVVVTHSHPDHFFPDALKTLQALHPFTLFASADIIKAAQEAGLECAMEYAMPGEVKNLEGFSVQAFDVPHERIPKECPHNMGYKINDTVYHPGDSYLVPSSLGSVRVLLLPNGGPWATTRQTVEFAEKIKPTTAVPIHDAMHKDFWLERLHASMAGWMQERGIEYKPLGPGESIEV